uniref:C-type lectin domain-containing protein n=1 Tax=Dicentrarchus labrax TaxID=13489 RepID=A0A8C4NYT3_DICLA
MFYLVYCLLHTLQITGTAEMSTTDDDTNKEVSSCPPGWTQFGSRCFIFFHSPKTWIDAEHTCISAGGNLASIHSADENVFLRNLIVQVTSQHLHTWIGAHDGVQEGKWMWSDGSKFDYQRWSIGEPNNYNIEHCAEMNWGGNYWNDSQCQHGKHFVCAKDL